MHQKSGGGREPQFVTDEQTGGVLGETRSIGSQPPSNRLHSEKSGGKNEERGSMRHQKQKRRTSAIQLRKGQ